MRILITTPLYPPNNSGMANAVKQQVQSLTSRGVSVVVATGGVIRKTRIDDSIGVEVEEFNVSGSNSLRNPLRGDVLSYINFLTNSTFDLVLMNGWQAWSTDVCLKCLKKIHGKKVLYSHGLSTNTFFASRWVSSFVRYLLWRPYAWRLKMELKKLDALIALAPYGCDSRFEDVKVARSLGVPIFIVPNAIDQEAIRYLSEPPLGASGRNQIISVGSYDWRKGHDFVLRSYARSSAKNVIPLKIFGQKFTEFTLKLRSLATALSIDARFISFQEGLSGQELLHEYRKSLAFLYGSWTECQPLVILDAMAAGTPFISRASGCINTLSGGYAINSEESAAAKLDDLLRDEMEWNSRSLEGMKAAKNSYRPDVVGEKLHLALREILQES